LALHVSTRCSLTVCLFFQLVDCGLLGLEFAFQLRNLLALEFDQGLDAARLSLSAIA